MFAKDVGCFLFVSFIVVKSLRRARIYCTQVRVHGVKCVLLCICLAEKVWLVFRVRVPLSEVQLHVFLRQSLQDRLSELDVESF